MFGRGAAATSARNESCRTDDERGSEADLSSESGQEELVQDHPLSGITPERRLRMGDLPGRLDRAFEEVSVGGVRFAIASPDEVIWWILSLHRQSYRGYAVRFANSWNVALANDDPLYRKTLSDPNGINFADGAPVALFMRLFTGRKGRGASRVRGPSAFRSVLAKTPADLGHFFLGGSPETLEALISRVKEDFPSVRISGAYSPPYAAVDGDFLAECEEAVRGTRSDLIWIGLGTPKQDVVASHLAARTNTPALGVGAAFDFLAGTLREAPLGVQRSGFEWLFRFASEPKRLAHRYLYGNARFLWCALASIRRGRSA